MAGPYDDRMAQRSIECYRRHAARQMACLDAAFSEIDGWAEVHHGLWQVKWRFDTHPLY